MLFRSQWKLVGTRLLYMKKEPTINVGFVMTHGPENEHLKKECAGLYVSIICQRSMEITEDLIVDLA